MCVWGDGSGTSKKRRNRWGPDPQRRKQGCGAVIGVYGITFKFIVCAINFVKLECNDHSLDFGQHGVTVGRQMEAGIERELRPVHAGRW